MSELAPMKAQVYKDPRPAEHFDRFHERARTREPDWVYDLVRVLVTGIAYVFFRMRPIAAENAPASGPVILAPNHFSFFDHFFLAAALRRKVRFMAKSQLFNPPLQFIYTHGGVFPVLRGRRDEEAFKTAHAILDRGDMVLMYLEGGRSRTGDLGEARPGVGRLALESGVPVVPVAIFGSQGARNWKRLQFPKVTVHFGDPVRFERVEHPSREQSQAAAELVFEQVRELYYGLQRHGRRRAVRAARAARRAAEGAGRRPVPSP